MAFFAILSLTKHPFHYNSKEKYKKQEQLNIFIKNIQRIKQFLMVNQQYFAIKSLKFSH